MKTPELNVYWKDIPAGAPIEWRGGICISTRPDGRPAVVYWMGKECREALRFLARKEAA